MSLIRSRFEKEASKLVSEYTGSLPFDCLLYAYDIEGSTAHAKMLGRQGVITAKESRAIIRGLGKIRQEIEDGEFEFKPELEDIHMAVEARLIELIGDTGRKLHTARSRNDQVALDLRLFLRDITLATLTRIRELEHALVQLASDNKNVVMPGYTHLQLAQPVLFAHHLLAYFEMLERDRGRLADGLMRLNVMPLGSGALAGVAYNIDRKQVAKLLDFSEVSRNSMDAVSDRDFVIEFESAASILMMHLSRLAEEFILWSSAEFDFVEFDDAYATSSSIMPQKKNPDVAELARGKTGRVYGNLMAMLTTMKGLNRQSRPAGGQGRAFRHHRHRPPDAGRLYRPHFHSKGKEREHEGESRERLHAGNGYCRLPGQKRRGFQERPRHYRQAGQLRYLAA